MAMEELVRHNMIYLTYPCLRAVGEVNWEADTIKAMLLRATYKPDRRHAHRRDVIEHEIPAGGGYVAGGLKVTGRKVELVGDELRYQADPLCWRAPSIQAAYCVLYRARGMRIEDDPLIQLLDIRIDDGGERASWNGEFEVEFDVKGVMCEVV